MWKRIIDNCITHIWEWIVLVIPTGLSIFLAWYPETKINQISIRVWITLCILLFLTMVILVKALITTVSIAKEAITALPQLKLIEEDVLIFSPSELFATNSIVSIWYIDSIERIVGYGIIETVNSQKYLQVKIEQWLGDYNTDFIRRNKNKIVLKPTILSNAITIASTQKEENNV